MEMRMAGARGPRTGRGQGETAGLVLRILWLVDRLRVLKPTGDRIFNTGKFKTNAVASVNTQWTGLTSSTEMGRTTRLERQKGGKLQVKQEGYIPVIILTYQ